jgi:hypothetical protein
MQDYANSKLPAPNRMPWNKGKLIGAKRTRIQPVLDLLSAARSNARFNWAKIRRFRSSKGNDLTSPVRAFLQA